VPETLEELQEEEGKDEALDAENLSHTKGLR